MLKFNSELPQNVFEPFLNHNDPIEPRLIQFIKSDDEDWNLQPVTNPRLRSLLYFGQEIQPDGVTDGNTDFKENSRSHLEKHMFTNQCNDTYIPRTTETLSTFNCNSLPASHVSSEINDREYRDYSSNKPSKSFLNLEVLKLQNDFTFSPSENCTFSSIYSNTTTVLEKNSILHYNEGSDYMKNGLMQTQCINLSNNLVDLNYSPETSLSQMTSFDTELVKYEDNNNLFRRDLYLQDSDFIDKVSNEMAPVSLNSYCCNKCQPPNLERIGNETKRTTDFISNTTKLSTFENTIYSLPWDDTNPVSTNLLKTSNNNIYNGRSTMRDIYEANPYSQNHTIPEGDDFVQMFQRRQIPALELRFVENKSTVAIKTALDPSGAFFGVAMLIDAHEQFQSEQDVTEARKTESEILSIYPLHNKNYQRKY